ncbi:glutathione-disulfide reductase [uncultured Porticoccus sp.]|uniref:glutathione-disulfide reductase n=1 Tax=uncultured Porticoccus sp. TaxID=1256050 RepID=UPI0026289058|nr:glutathione-disulfide reductase [uncultured Porticoccus sp.]
MADHDVDLFVIGAGSGGVRTARMCAQQGLRVVVAESQYLGGTCVNVGCVPKKLFVYASSFREEFRAAKGFGWQVGESSFDWPTLRDNKNREIQRLNDIYGNLLDKAGVELVEGWAKILGPDSVEINGQVYRCKKILIATGGTPFVPEFPGREYAITSNEAFYLDSLPDRIVIVGGGYIAIEFAGIFNGLGVETHLLYRGELFLRGFDQDVREVLKEEVEKQGVILHFSTDIESIEKMDDGLFKAVLNSGDSIEAGLVMYATGRRPNIEGLGLENTTIETRANGAIIVDDYFQTAEPSIYAIGDVIGRVELTPVAINEGMALTKTLVTDVPTTIDYTNIPTAVFSQPNTASVGLTEEQAREVYGDNLRIYRSKFRAMKETLGGGDNKVFMKLIVINDNDRVVGCHMVGEGAGEIIQGIAIAVKMGATKADFDATIGIHPTAAEEFVTMRDVT